MDTLLYKLLGLILAIAAVIYAFMELEAWIAMLLGLLVSFGVFFIIGESETITLAQAGRVDNKAEASEDEVLLEAMAEVDQGTVAEAEDKEIPPAASNNTEQEHSDIPQRFARVHFLDWKVVHDGQKFYFDYGKNYDYICNLDEVAPEDYVWVVAGPEVKRAKVVEVFSKSFSEMPLPENRYSKVISIAAPFDVDVPITKEIEESRCVKVKFRHDGKSYSYRCGDENIGEGDFVRVKARGKKTTVKVVEVFYSPGNNWKSVLGEASVEQIREASDQFPEIQARHSKGGYNAAYYEDDYEEDEEEDPFDREMALAEAEEERQLAEYLASRPRASEDTGVSWGSLVGRAVLYGIVDGLIQGAGNASSGSGINSLPADYRTNKNYWHHPDNIYYEEYLDEGDRVGASDNWKSVTGESRKEYYGKDDM